MNAFLAGCLALMTVLLNCQNRQAITHTVQAESQQVAKDFRYPESPETIKDGTPYGAKTLAGRVIDPAGAGMEKVLVERLDSGWGKRIDATFTDSDGSFSFFRYSGKTQFLRLSKPGFNTLLVKVRIKKNLKSQLKLKLGLSQ